MQIDRLVRERERSEITGIPCSSWYERIDDGLATPGVKLSKHAVAWPLSELGALNAARIAGKTDDEIRKLVVRLIAARASACDRAASHAA
jgi:prophage regulatory protein